MSKTGAARATFFGGYFGVSGDLMENYGVFNISLINDHPLFVGLPFLLFNNEKDEYRAIPDEIVDYLSFLRDKSDSGPKMKVDSALVLFSGSQAELTWLFCLREREVVSSSPAVCTNPTAMSIPTRRQGPTVPWPA